MKPTLNQYTKKGEQFATPTPYGLWYYRSGRLTLARLEKEVGYKLGPDTIHVLFTYGYISLDEYRVKT
jgi:hypothetical protein